MSGTTGEGEPIEPSVVLEHRIVLPLSLEESKIGKLFTVGEFSKEETGGGEGVEVVINEPREKGGEKGQYTHKIIHLQSKLPKVIRMIAPFGSLQIQEKSWNHFPEIRTEYSNKSYRKDMFSILVRTIYKVGYEQEENVFGLSADKLSKRKIDCIDFVNDQIDSRDYKEDEDPAKFKSTKRDRGPLNGTEWYKNQTPVVTCYKLYEIIFVWWGLQGKVESIIVTTVRRLLMQLYRKMFSLLDKYCDMTKEDIRKYEDALKIELDDLRNSGEARGMSENR